MAAGGAEGKQASPGRGAAGLGEAGMGGMGWEAGRGKREGSGFWPMLCPPPLPSHSTRPHVQVWEAGTGLPAQLHRAGCIPTPLGVCG